MSQRVIALRSRCLLWQSINELPFLHVYFYPPMGSLTRLRSSLLGTLEAQNPVDQQELFDLLVLHRRNLVNVFDTKPPSEDERKELRSGAYFIGFRSAQLTLSSQANVLSTVSNCPSMMILQRRLSTLHGFSIVQNVILLGSCNMLSPITQILAP